MFKKIHSNRDPRDTLYREIKKEFGTYFDKTGNWFRGLTARYPKFLFGTMIFTMLVSIGLSFTVFRHKETVAKVKKPPKSTLSPVAGGFDQIMQVGSALRETIKLKKLVDSVSAKHTLTKADSTVLEEALDSLQQINNHLKKQ
jgi:cell shape-determining protein MreC